MLKFDLSTDWSEGILEVWKGQTRAAVQFLILIAIGTAIAYFAGLDSWVFGAALAALLIGTVIMLSITTVIWIIIGKLWGKYVPDKYHVTPYLKRRPAKARTASVLGLTGMFFVLLYFIFTLPSDSSVTVGIAATEVSIGLKGFMYSLLFVLSLLLGYMWYDHIQVIREFRSMTNRDKSED